MYNMKFSSFYILCTPTRSLPSKIAHWMTTLFIASSGFPQATVACFAQDIREQELSRADASDLLTNYRTQLSKLERSLSGIHATAEYEAHLKAGLAKNASDRGPAKLTAKAGYDLSCWLSSGKSRLSRSSKFLESSNADGRQGEALTHFETVYINSGSAASLASRKTNDSPYILINRGADDSADPLSDYADINRYVRPQLSCDHYYIPTLLSEAGIRIEKTCRLMSAGTMSIRFYFADNSIKDVKTTGWWMVDPSANWVVTEYSVEQVPKNPNFEARHTMYGKITYVLHSDSVPIPSDVAYLHTHVMEPKRLDSAASRRLMKNAGGLTVSYRDKAVSVHLTSYELKPQEEGIFSLASIGLADAERPLGPQRSLLESILPWGGAIAFGLALLLCFHRYKAARLADR
jgi:hypothetical protein